MSDQLQPIHQLDREPDPMAAPLQPIERGPRRLIDGRDFRRQAGLADAPHSFWYRRQQAKMPPGMAMPPLDPAGHVAQGPTVVAIVNAGRWVGLCPLCGAGAEAIDPVFPYFWCTSCANEKAGGKYLPLDVHTRTVRSQVARALLVRPERKQQGWRPDRGEPVANLVAENREHELADQLTASQVEVD